MGCFSSTTQLTESLTKKIDFDSTGNGSISLWQPGSGQRWKTLWDDHHGGANDYGVLFEYNPTNGTLTKKIDFDNAGNGRNPMAAWFRPAMENSMG